MKYSLGLKKNWGNMELYFYLYYFELGIPMNMEPERVIRMFLRAVKVSNVFIGIIGNEYGAPIQTFIKDAVERYYYHGRDDKALRYLDNAEELIDSNLDRDEYREICDMISIVRSERKIVKER